MNPRDLIIAPHNAQALACPVCEAAANVPCKAASGASLHLVHAARYFAATCGSARYEEHASGTVVVVCRGEELLRLRRDSPLAKAFEELFRELRKQGAELVAAYAADLVVAAGSDPIARAEAVTRIRDKLVGELVEHGML